MFSNKRNLTTDFSPRSWHTSDVHATDAYVKIQNKLHSETYRTQEFGEGIDKELLKCIRDVTGQTN